MNQITPEAYQTLNAIPGFEDIEQDSESIQKSGE